MLEGEIQQALTELERLKKFKETFDNYELAKKQDFIAYENWQECEVELKKSIIKLEDLIETFDNYILQLNARIKINKEIIEENFDLNPSLCHDLEVENTALEFALMLLEGEKNE